MPFWTEDYKRDLQDPKRNFRFIVQITGLQATNANTDIVWYAKEVTKPSFTVNVAEHAYLNHKFKFPGTVTWNDIDLTVVDPQHSVDAADALSQLWTTSGYEIPPGPNGPSTDLQTVSKGRAVSAMGQVTVTQVNANGDAIETWTLKNAFCKGITYGDSIAYGNDELTTYKLSIVYDFAQIVTPSGTNFDI